MEQLQNDIKHKEEYLKSRNQYKKDLEAQLLQITNSRFYKYWQTYSRNREIFLNYFRINFSFIKKVKNPLKQIVKKCYFLYLEIEQLYKIKFSKTTFIVENIVTKPSVSVLVPTYGSVDNLKRLLCSIQKYPDKIKYEILICNDDPTATEEIKKWYKSDKNKIPKNKISIINNNINLGFVASINNLAKISKGEYLFLLNDDTEVIDNFWLSSLLMQFRDESVGVAGSFLLFPNINLVQHAGMYPFRKEDGKIWNYHFYKFFNKKYPEIKTRHVPMLTGASMLIQKRMFFKLGMLDYRYLGAAGFDDSDLCNKVIKRNQKIIFVKESKLIHHEGNTVKKIINKKNLLLLDHNQKYYQKKWNKFLKVRYSEYV